MKLLAGFGFVEGHRKDDVVERMFEPFEGAAMFTVGAIVLATVLALFTGRKNNQDRQIYDNAAPDMREWLVLLHARQDLKLISSLLFGVIVMLGMVADRPAIGLKHHCNSAGCANAEFTRDTLVTFFPGVSVLPLGSAASCEASRTAAGAA